MILRPEAISKPDLAVHDNQNDLKEKLAEEITCVMCGNFPYSPMECRRCNKLFCKNCQLELEKASGNMT